MRCRLLPVVLSVFCCSLLAIPALAQPRRYALVVGVREYPASEKLDKLPYAETDASRLAEVLSNTGYDVTLMTQTASKAEGAERFAPSATFLRREFSALVKTPFLKADDCVLVTLAGHGIQLPSKTNPKQTAYYFCPADAQIDSLEFLEDVTDRHNLISVDELFAVLKTCKAGVRLLVVDACRNDPTKPSAFRSTNSVTRPPVAAPPGGVAALFSCSANEKAVEDGTLQHGVFTHYLIEALSGQADTDKNGELSISEIESYVGLRTFDFVRKKYGRQQLPELKGEIQGWAALATLSPAKPGPMPTVTPTPGPPMPAVTPQATATPRPAPALQKVAVGTQAGQLLTAGGMKLCWCPPGKFTMGSPTGEKQRDHEFETQVSVTLTKGFFLGQHEVTQELWKSVMGSTPWQGQSYVKEGVGYPACYMNWDEASEFCVKLTARGHQENWLPKDWKIVLPTEAQWEYACRAGTTTAYSFGDEESKLSEYGWFKDNAYTKGERYAHPVGQKKTNPWNLSDMHGNVWEWCRDRFSKELPGGTDPDAQKGVQEQSQYPTRVYRGGSWGDQERLCRSARRQFGAPYYRDYYLGIRIALVQVP